MLGRFAMFNRGLAWLATYFEGQELNWGRVLQGDRFYALLQLRALTCGPEGMQSESFGEGQ